VKRKRVIREESEEKRKERKRLEENLNWLVFKVQIMIW
jgi:hypothetical protein